MVIFVSSANIFAHAVTGSLEDRLYRLRKTKNQEYCPVGLRECECLLCAFVSVEDWFSWSPVFFFRTKTKSGASCYSVSTRILSGCMKYEV